MLTHLINEAGLPTESAIVLGVGAAFFLVQIALCCAVCIRVRRQEQDIAELSRESELGEPTQGGIGNPSGKSAWSDWVVSHYPVNGPERTSSFSRDDALQELDARLASDGSYLLLQRMSVMAPLLGVVLTVAGFYWLKVDEEDQSLQSILWAVTPLISGVGTGAVLAIINQALLHVAGRRIESLRMTARSWFDSAIWDRRGIALHADSTSAAHLTDDLVQSALEDIDRLSDKLARVAEINAAISALPEQLREVLEWKLPVDRNADSADSLGRIVARIPRTAK